MPRFAAQPDLFGAADPAPAPAEAAPEPIHWPEEYLALVRMRLTRLLAQAEAAERLPWDTTRAWVHELTFENEAPLLPDGEALKTRFYAELDRLFAIESRITGIPLAQ